jgi:hypothetical protein
MAGGKFDPKISVSPEQIRNLMTADQPALKTKTLSVRADSEADGYESRQRD